MRKVNGVLLSLLIGIAAFSTVVFAAGDTFVIGVYTDPITFDPARVHDAQSGVVTWNTYEGLLKYDFTDYSIKPSLAESWEIAQDSKSCTFHIRRGVIFHDGTPFNAEAVAYTFERFLDIGASPAMFLNSIKRWEVKDEYTITFSTDQPWAFWEDAFASNKGLRIPSPTYIREHITADDPRAEKWMNEHTCGTGPYKLVEWVRAQYVRCEKFDQYWGGWDDPRKFKEFIVKIVPEASMRLLMLKSGEVDYCKRIPARDVADLKAHPDVDVIVKTGSAQMFIFFNCSKPPLNDPKLREAISYAVDYDSAVKLYPYSVVAQGILPRAMPGHNPDVPVSKQDLEKAKQIMKEAGYKPGDLKLEQVYISGTDYQEQVATLIKQNLAKIGIEVSLRAMPWSVYSPIRYSPETAPQMAFLYLEPFLADPIGIIHEAFTPHSIGPSGFGSWYNETMGYLDELALRVANRPARWEIYKMMQEITWPGHPVLYMWEMPFFYSYRTSVKGLVPDYHQHAIMVYSLWREES